WRRLLPPCLVTRSGHERIVAAHAPAGSDVQVWVELEDGGRRDDVAADPTGVRREIDGRELAEVGCRLPADLPLGWHRLRARAAGEEAECSLVVTPPYLGLPEGIRDTRTWGWMVQLYQVRSRESWGLGDLGDLRRLADGAGREHAAGFVLVNPLHAAEPVAPMEPSPYLPTTRRFMNPVYLRVEDVPEYAELDEETRAQVEGLAATQRPRNLTDDQLDRDAVWTAKRAALELIHAAGRSPQRQAAYDEYREREGQGLTDFATWCALVQRYDGWWRKWPEELHDPASAAVEAARKELAERVDFWCWLQWLLDEQLASAQTAASAVGMPVGVVHDLAVGVHPGGADSWGLQHVLASGVSVGAPPDAFNQQGQDWSQPPWRPDALAETGYAPYRDMLRTILRHAGGIRIDHILGLFRLWWVPQGAKADQGTYVRYDHEALVGILALEAQRAGAFAVGEDLGTVEPWVRDYLAERGILGTSILWFERDWEGNREPLPPERWRELCLATVATHDLPPTAGYLTGEHIRIRSELGLLTRDVEEERRVDAQEREAVLSAMRRCGLLPEGAGERETVESLHRFLTQTPSRLLGAALSDAVGDRRAVNQPGTSDEYPNWRVPMTDAQGRPVLLDEILADDRVRSLARAVTP
ncbi:MAG: 4-alpha-glucanotransferase, partial [Actinomycetota bacterium]|nr:4-alpha-glucanotransferase [Actinomycetota bacterium]